MPKRNSNGLKGVQIHGDKLRIWFTLNGIRYFEPLSLKPTPANLRFAARLRAEIVEKIRYIGIIVELWDNG